MVRLRFHHVGIGTTEFDGAIDAYVRLGHVLVTRVDDPGLNVRVAFLSGPQGSGPWVEVLAPLGPNGPLDALLKRRSLPAPYHTCYAVEELQEASQLLRDSDFMQLGAPKPALAFGGQPVVFFVSATIGMVELVERPPSQLATFETPMS